MYLKRMQYDLQGFCALKTKLTQFPGEFHLKSRIQDCLGLPTLRD